MKKWMLAICLMFINEICQATDCFDLAGRDYKIDPDLLRAISWQESRYRVNAIGINPVTGYGSGLMQVDSQHFNELARYGIKPEHLTTDPGEYWACSRYEQPHAFGNKNEQVSRSSFFICWTRG